MAQRSETKDVLAVLPHWGRDPLQEHLDAAVILIDEVEAASTYSAAKLKQLEIRLAAHFAYMVKPRPSQVSAGGHSVTRTTLDGEGLNATPHGSIIAALDSDNVLTDLLQKRRVASLQVFGQGIDISEGINE